MRPVGEFCRVSSPVAADLRPGCGGLDADPEQGTTSEAEWGEIEESARTVTRAEWWIDQRSSEPEDLTELLRAATGVDRPTENPFF
ncbi:hypothetical protein [Streptomyces sp. NPDC058847]|uniref:hypothetical protein n=1 Tax=Streptomyces sp. NPDC058847 TaxID=3346649 RepID=UPI00369BE9A6